MNAPMAGTADRRRSTATFSRWVMNVSGRDYCGIRGDVPEAPTMHTRSRHGVDHVVASNNDGSEVWFGYPEKWTHHIDETEARRLFWWLLVRWFGQARWFGLRRPIYYWALHREVNRSQRQAVTQ